MASNFPLVRYTLLPEFIPRIVSLFTSGFGTIAYLIAIIFESARLLPPGHPYTSPHNIGKFSIRHVLAQGADNLVFSRKNIDRIILYFAVLSGMSLIILQLVTFILALIAQQPAIAQIITPQELFFQQASPDQDIVLMLLDRIFGASEAIFGSCISNTNIDCLDANGNPLPPITQYPFPFHVGLHAMFRFYSFGIFIVSVIVIIYIGITIVGETATTGTPFGQRMNKIWYPVRFILFLALLIPLNAGQEDPVTGANPNEGFNAGQIITFWVAKTGSNFATNGWNRFTDSLSGEYLAFSDKLIATPNIPELGALVQYMFLAKTCAIAEETVFEDDDDTTPLLHNVEPYLVRERQLVPIILGDDSVLMEETSFDIARQFVKNGNISIRFGVKPEDNAPNKEDFNNFRGFVDPVCGEIQLILTSKEDGGGLISGTSQIQEFYYDMIIDMWNDTLLSERAVCIAKNTLPQLSDQTCEEEPTASFARERITFYQERLKASLPGFIQQQMDSGEWAVSQQLKDKGWGGAAIWYNRIAQLNGSVTSAILGIPQPSQYPSIMENIAQQHRMISNNLGSDNIFNLTLPDGESVLFERDGAEDAAKAMVKAYNIWENDSFSLNEETNVNDNIIFSVINAVFGTSGIFDIRKNSDVHPLAQLSNLGRSMMEASIRNLGIGVIGEGAGKLFNGIPGELAEAGGGFFYSLGISMFAMSFILYYVLPFMPFIYFLFAISGWVKSIFEAIVAMPLWAMAHLTRIDGEGIPGPAAISGYMLLAEILIRPILIVFGLIASISIFSALVLTLNDVFDYVIDNIGGYNIEEGVTALTPVEEYLEVARAPLDEFFYTALYTIVVYITGLSAFKLIDLIPGNIMRYAGQTVSSFQEEAKEAPGEVINRSYQGITLATNNAQGGLLAALVS